MPNAKRKLSSSPKRKRGRPPKRSKLLAEEGLATGSRSKNKTKTKKTAIEPTASCSIYRNPKKRRIYYESCLNLPITFDSYVPSQQPKKNKDGDFPHQTFNVSVGDTIILHGDDSCKATPPKNQQGPTKKERWYPFIVPWMTCQVLSIYQQESKKKNKHGQPILEPCMFQVRYFNRKTESSLKEIPIAKDGDDDDKNRTQEMNCQKREGRTIAKERNIEEIYETDLCGDVFLRNILAKVYIVPNRNQLDSAGDSNRVVIPSPNAVEQHKEQDQRQNDTTPIEQFCQTCLVLMNKREYTLISASTGRCIYDEDLGKTIAQFIKKNITSTSNNQSDIDLFWFHRFCRGLKFLSNSDKTLSDGFIKSTLKFAHQRGGVREEDDPCDILESDSESKSTSSGNENEDDNVEDVELEVEEDEEEEEEEQNEMIIHDVSSISSNEMTPFTPKKTKINSLPPTPCSVASTQIDRGWALELPFHVDVANRKAFFSEIHMKIPFENYIDCYSNTCNKDDLEWKFSIGDTVAIHIVEGSSKNDMFPYIVPWWPGEIVSFYLNLNSHDEALRLREKVVADENGLNGIKKFGRFSMEIRWLYRKTDIPGLAKVKSLMKAANGTEEVFETDCVDEVEISSLLGRVALFSYPNDERQNITLCSGLPVINFFCHQFFSVQRKSLMAIGSAENRVQRGMLYSKYMGRDSAIRAAHEKINPNSDKFVGLHKKDDWKQLFQDTFAKLTLAESSAIGGQDEHKIIGREKERHQISQFLTASILAAHDFRREELTNANKFVFFIGGAPGTGKTASVRSIIYGLNKEQAEGKLPCFQFVSVNGMEMRHPFDVYVRLWEAVSNRKEICPAGEALAKLEMYFGENPSRKIENKEITQKRKVVVVLVDEIDYLVTKKQTVLYNLFNWPSRGFSTESPAQLIIIGISNTLNLPERLHTRLQSRIGNERCIYISYSVDQIIGILKGKLGIMDSNESIFHEDALKFAARKVSSLSGDIRKVFHLCKAAAENVYNDIILGKRVLSAKLHPHLGLVNIADVQKASRKMFHSTIQRGVSDASDMEALLFISLGSLKLQLAREKGGFDLNEVVTKMEGIASSFGDERYIPSPTCSELLRMLNRLGEAKIITFHTMNDHQSGGYRMSGGPFNTMISLPLDKYELLSALKDTHHNKLAEKYLSSS